ncbi:C39 family peptidase [Patescibacteria group bacterium]|nr:C39 family peptidase [Patescibacteria group bacterium]MBU1029160.1 C39 family peptidase [Patescibacteria group bacterium]MBU1916072.1 C39 family peptidase [Patescibacteria group bacterium]
MARDSRQLMVISSLTLTLAVGWLVYGVRYDVLDAYRGWQRGPLPVAIPRLEFERAVSGVPTAQAEMDQMVETTSTTTLDSAVAANNTTAESKTEEVPLKIVINEALPTAATPKTEPALPPAVNLKIPFMVQAPTQNWDTLHGEACEEASAIMLAAYYNNEDEITIEEAESRIMDAVTFEAETYGYHLDTTAAETARTLREHFDISGARVVTLNSIEDIKVSLAAGHPVIVPAYGKTLGNPNFRNGGPLYHMLVIKGYTETHFITNDPGTRRGANYIYDFQTLWDAIHDWNGGDVQSGAKVMIAVR